MTRRIEWLVLIAAVAIAWPVWSYRGERTRPGDTIDAQITLITSDRDQLSCASPRVFGKYRCEFKSSKRAWPDPPTGDEQLAPYYTTDGRFILVPGLFQQPALAARYAREAPAHKSVKRRRRFVARCTLRLVAPARAVQARWRRSAHWGKSPAGWVAEPVSCQLADD